MSSSSPAGNSSSTASQLKVRTPPLLAHLVVEPDLRRLGDGVDRAPSPQPRAPLSARRPSGLAEVSVLVKTTGSQRGGAFRWRRASSRSTCDTADVAVVEVVPELLLERRGPLSSKVAGRARRPPAASAR